MKNELGRLLAAGAIIGVGAFGANNHTVSAGGGGGLETPGWRSESVVRPGYQILIPNTGWEVFRVVSRTEDIETTNIKKKGLNANRNFPFIHFVETIAIKVETGERGATEGVGELRENCEVVFINKIDDSVVDVAVKDANCLPPK